MTEQHDQLRASFIKIGTPRLLPCGAQLVNTDMRSPEADEQRVQLDFVYQRGTKR